EWAADQDPHFRREFYQVLLPLMQQMGKTVFAISMTSHYFQHWPSPGTSFCWMNGRRIRIRISAASSTRSCCR
ncbi:hypothetical protein CKQ90_33425, partial [Klebsiella pneumoniae]